MYLTLVLAALAAAGIVAPFCTFAERRALKDGHPIAELYSAPPKHCTISIEVNHEESSPTRDFLPRRARACDFELSSPKESL